MKNNSTSTNEGKRDSRKIQKWIRIFVAVLGGLLAATAIAMYTRSVQSELAFLLLIIGFALLVIAITGGEDLIRRLFKLALERIEGTAPDSKEEGDADSSNNLKWIRISVALLGSLLIATAIVLFTLPVQGKLAFLLLIIGFALLAIAITGGVDLIHKLFNSALERIEDAALDPAVGSYLIRNIKAVVILFVSVGGVTGYSLYVFADNISETVEKLDNSLPQIIRERLTEYVPVIIATAKQGPIGPQGTAGPIGPQGKLGPQGSLGPQGLQGPAGPIGPQGKIGPRGPSGQRGLQGPIGTIGPQGKIAPRGPVGPQGIRGLPGPRGAEGPRGPRGYVDKSILDRISKYESLVRSYEKRVASLSNKYDGLQRSSNSLFNENKILQDKVKKLEARIFRRIK